MIDSVFRAWRTTSLQWLPEQGMGYLPFNGNRARYDREYWEKYVGYAATPLGEALTNLRLELVHRHLPRHEALIDVGIGCGQFVEARAGATFGYDVNPLGVRWLTDRHLYRDPTEQVFPAATFFDSLEHIEEPGPILRNIRKWAFVACPIFRDVEHVLSSKHFRPGEHCFYYTRDGLVRWMVAHGFGLVEENDLETQAGREDVASFAFRRLT